jgi:xanthine dehydrogenase accessory factor
MIKNIGIWKFITESLAKNIPVMLLYVLESKGSSPGRQGFFMAVNAKAEMEGSIGGGIMEHKFVEMAREKLQSALGGNKRQAGQLKKQVHDKSVAKDQSGMICSGEQTIWIYQLGDKDQIHIVNMIRSLEENKNGTLKLSPNGIQFSESTPDDNFHFAMRSEEDWNYTAKTGFKNRLFIVGGGHCALALSKLMRTMDFYIHLFDDRENLNTMLQNDFAHEKKQLEDYRQLSELIPGDYRNHYVVVMTFGYRTDEIALRALIDKDFKYLGLLGSKNKIVKMFEDLRKEGISETVLQRIHAPIGLAIKSETPEEIAVSIAAEIIKVKNGR